MKRDSGFAVVSPFALPPLPPPIVTKLHIEEEGNDLLPTLDQKLKVTIFDVTY